MDFYNLTLEIGEFFKEKFFSMLKNMQENYSNFFLMGLFDIRFKLFRADGLVKVVDNAVISGVIDSGSAISQYLVLYMEILMNIIILNKFNNLNF